MLFFVWPLLTGKHMLFRMINQLGSEKSAYLLQHKGNPVAWWSYGPEAISEAKKKDRPIFLSIGYSSCHWCHVMAHESFEDEKTAQFLNDHFICIKVDREEYPDIDQYYQRACQLFIRTGGWPLSAFLLPNLRPFFVGTYYPKEKRSGGISFGDLLRELQRAYQREYDQVEENAEKVVEALAEFSRNPFKKEPRSLFKRGTLKEKDLEDKEEVIKREDVERGPWRVRHSSFLDGLFHSIFPFFDLEYGGFGKAPKFPHFPFHEFVLEQMLEGALEERFGTHTLMSLEKMLLGGITDHARGGIHRYSTDHRFLVPHFEKMLYDQAGFLRVLAKGGLLLSSPLVYDALLNTLEYLSAEMVGEEGYFFSAQDADSEGKEGLYFGYTEKEFESLVHRALRERGKDVISGKMETLKAWFQITREGHFENGLNVISLSIEFKKDFFDPDSWEMIRRIRREVLEDRRSRIPPATDTKGVASWNFEMVSALADVIQYCPLWAIKKKAEELFNRAISGLYRNFFVDEEEGERIRHSTTLSQGPSYLEDYATLLEAQLRAYEITANPLFKDNLKETLKTILQEFISDQGILLSRSNQNSIAYFPPNERADFFDGSFKSSASTLIGVTRRIQVLLGDPSQVWALSEVSKELREEALKNPLGGGEALRASIYPEEAYRVVKIPALWRNREDFLALFHFFLPRFVFDYHWEKEETWQICALGHCEKQGKGFESFSKLFESLDGQRGLDFSFLEEGPQN